VLAGSCKLQGVAITKRGKRDRLSFFWGGVGEKQPTKGSVSGVKNIPLGENREKNNTEGGGKKRGRGGGGRKGSVKKKRLHGGSGVEKQQNRTPGASIVVSNTEKMGKGGRRRKGKNPSPTPLFVGLY